MVEVTTYLLLPFSLSVTPMGGATRLWVWPPATLHPPTLPPESSTRWLPPSSGYPSQRTLCGRTWDS